MPVPLTHWWHGLLARSLMAVVGISLLTGGVASLLISREVGEREHHQALERLNELIDTIESTARIACFTGDEQLAAEVAQGLLRNSVVQRVTIRAGEREVARAERASTGPVGHGWLDKIGSWISERLEREWRVTRSLVSPFDARQTVGDIVVDADGAAIEGSIQRSVGNLFLLMSIQMALVIAAVASTVLFLVVRPMKQTSDRLHHLKPASGERLQVPEGHERSEIGRLVGDINDLTGQLVDTLEQEQSLRRQQEIDQRKYHDLFDNASSGIFVCDRDGVLDSWNPAFLELTWFPQGGGAGDNTSGEIVAPSCQRRLLTDAGWDDRPQLLALLAACLVAGATGAGQKAGQGVQGTHEGDFLLRGRRGDERWLHVGVVALGNGSLQGTLSDVTQRKRDELSAQRLAITDSLTGFANREGLHQAMAVATWQSTDYALLMIDLDGFKQINDAMGFPVGDQLLLMVAGRLREHAGAHDLLARVGGDEFVWVVRDDNDKAAIAQRAERLLLRLRSPYLLSLQNNFTPLSMGATIGISLAPQDGEGIQELLRGAELALNKARDSGERAGSYRFYDPALQAAVVHRRRLEDDLRATMATSGLQVHFQPIIDLPSGRPVGAESLLRWQHPERGHVSPDSFIPLAEEIGLIGQIGLFVLEEACRQVAQWRAAGLDLYASVNVSARQIPDGLPPARVLDLLNMHGLPPEAIVLEITEGVLMNNIAAAQNWIESLRAVGIRIYLDDFGTGYSSLSYLKRFPLDTVKIDKSFVRDMSGDKSDRALVDAIITMARSLDLNVVAEGVEDDRQLALLRNMGCAMGQGYYFSRPVPARDFIPIVRRIGADLLDDAVRVEGN